MSTKPTIEVNEIQDILHWISNEMREGDGRNRTLFGGLCWMQSVGFSDEKIEEQAYNKNALFKEPMERAEVAKVISQVLKYTKGDGEAQREERRAKEREAWIDNRINELIGARIVRWIRQGDITAITFKEGGKVYHEWSASDFVLGMQANMDDLATQICGVLLEGQNPYDTPVTKTEVNSSDDEDEEELDLTLLIGGNTVR